MAAITVITQEQLLALLATDSPDPNDPAPPLMEGRAITLPDGRDTREVNIAWLRANVDMDVAVETWRDRHRIWLPNTTSAPARVTLPEPGTWLFDPWTCSYEVFLTFDPHQLANDEPERDGREHYSFATYLTWAREGHTPPPITVMRHADSRIISSNRRRLLVARDLDRPIGGWYSETTITGGLLWALPRGLNFVDTVERATVQARYAAQLAAWREARDVRETAA
jgi:hypothetical protein